MDLLKFSDKELYYFHVLLSVIMENKEYTSKGVSYVVLDEMPELVELLKSGKIFQTYQIPGKMIDEFSSKYEEYESELIDRIRMFVNLIDKNSSVYETLRNKICNKQKLAKAFLAPDRKVFINKCSELTDNEKSNNVSQFLQFLGLTNEDFDKVDLYNL